MQMLSYSKIGKIQIKYQIRISLNLNLQIMKKWMLMMMKKKARTLILKILICSRKKVLTLKVQRIKQKLIRIVGIVERKRRKGTGIVLRQRISLKLY